jgi:hypothetical protein
MMERSKIWIGSIVVDCTDFPRMMAFWQEALHYVPRESPEKDSVVLKDPEGQGPNLSLNQTSEGPLDDYRLHLDLYTADPEGEVERLIRLGATLKTRRGGKRLRHACGSGRQLVRRNQ